MPLTGGSVGLGILRQPAYGLPTPTLSRALDRSRLNKPPGVSLVVRDTASNGQGVTGGTTLSWTHLVNAGPNRAVFVGVGIGAGTDTMTASVTYDGAAMTSLGKVHNNNSTGGYTQLFWLPAPPIKLSTVIVTMSAAPVSIQAGSASYFNVDQVTPPTTTTAFGSSTLATINTSSAPGRLVLFLAGGGSAFNATPNSPDRLLWLRNQSAASGGGESGMADAYGDSALVHSWGLGSDWWSAISVDVSPSFAADATFTIDTPWWIGDFETGDLSQFSTDTSSYQPSTPVVASSSPTAQAGTYRGAFSVPAGTSVAGAGVAPRSESLPLMRDFAEGDDFWFGGYIRLDPSFPIPAAGQFSVVTQWKNEGTGSPPLELSINNDTSPAHWRIDGGFGYPGGSQQWVALDSTANTIVKDVWIRWDFHIVFSSDPAIAQIDVWKDGIQVVTGYHPTTLAGTLYPATTSYWKIGYYRSEAITGAGTVYHDSWRVGQTAASVNFAAAATGDNPGWSWGMNI